MPLTPSFLISLTVRSGCRQALDGPGGGLRVRLGAGGQRPAAVAASGCARASARRRRSASLSPGATRAPGARRRCCRARSRRRRRRPSRRCGSGPTAARRRPCRRCRPRTPGGALGEDREGGQVDLPLEGAVLVLAVAELGDQVGAAEVARSRRRRPRARGSCARGRRSSSIALFVVLQVLDRRPCRQPGRRRCGLRPAASRPSIAQPVMPGLESPPSIAPAAAVVVLGGDEPGARLQRARVRSPSPRPRGGSRAAAGTHAEGEQRRGGGRAAAARRARRDVEAVAVALEHPHHRGPGGEHQSGVPGRMSDIEGYSTSGQAPDTGPATARPRR